MSDTVGSIKASLSAIGLEVSCGSDIIDKCKDLNIPWGEDWTFQMLLGDLIDAAQMLLKYGVKFLAPEASENMMRGINSLKCMLDNVGENAWNLIAAAYWGLLSFGYEKDMLPTLDKAYEHVCTCQEDAQSLVSMLGPTTAADAMFTGCSELTGNNKLLLQERREEFVVKRKEANERAIQQAAQTKRKQEAEGKMKLILAEDGDEGLEKVAMEAFRNYREKAETLSKKNIQTQQDKEALKKAKLEYLAAQEGKRDLQVRNLEVKVTDWVKNDNTEAVVWQAEDYMMELELATNRQEEFPEDEQANVDAEVAESKVQAMKIVVKKMVDEDRLGLKDTATFKEITRESAEKVSYNKLYHEAKQYFKAGEFEELEVYYEAIEEEFTAAEKAYAEAKSKKDWNPGIAKYAEPEKELAVLLEASTSTYNAAMNVRFDLEEDAQKEDSGMQVELAPEERKEVEDTVDYLRKEKTELTKMLKYKYDQKHEKLNKAYADPEDMELQESAARADAEYGYYKSLAKTAEAEDQKALDDEALYGEPELATEIEETEAQKQEKTIKSTQKQNMGLELSTTDLRAIEKEAETALATSEGEAKTYVKIVFKVYMKLNIRMKENDDDLDLKYEANRAKTKHIEAKKAVDAARKKLETAEPEKAAQRKAKIVSEEKAAAKAREEAEKLPEDVEIIILESLKEVLDTTGGAKAAGELVKKQKASYDAAVALAKKTATDRTVPAEQRAKLTAVANTEQKKLLALTTGVKQHEQRAFDAKALAKKKEQEIVDKANKVAVDPTDKTKIYKDLKKVTFVASSVKRVKLMNVEATSYYQIKNGADPRDDHHPSKGIDGNRDTYFALQGGQKDGSWKAEFSTPQTKVSRIKVTSSAQWASFSNYAKIYVGTSPKIVKSILGQSYVQSSGIGFASYHFDEYEQFYISYSNAPTTWKLDDGSYIPARKDFKNSVYTPADRTLKATVSWGKQTWNGDSTWEYIMVFSKDFQSIESGTVVHKDSNGAVTKTMNFGKEINYNLSQIKKEDQLCGTMPKETMTGKDYTFDCEAVGDYVKIVTGDKTNFRLAFANVEAYGTNQDDKIKKMRESKDRMVNFIKPWKDNLVNVKGPMEARREAAEKARQAKLEAADPKTNYEFSQGYCRRQGKKWRHDHKSRSINTQDRTACQFNCDAKKNCVAFEMAPRCWWYTRDTDLAGDRRAKKECWVKRPVAVAPTPVAPVDPIAPVVPVAPLEPICRNGTKKICTAKRADATASWCNSNCNHKPAHCPSSHCACKREQICETPKAPTTPVTPVTPPTGTVDACGSKALQEFGPNIPPTAPTYWADQSYHMNAKDRQGSYDRVLKMPFDERKDQFCKEVSNQAAACCKNNEKIADVAKIDITARKCANEGETCKDCKGFIWYGQPGTLDKLKSKGHKSLYFENGAECTNKVFGDPLYGVRKQCICVAEENNRECGKQGSNFGHIKTPEDCAIVAGKEGYDYFMFSKEYPSWGCRGCATADGGKAHKLWNVFAVDGDYTRYKKDYYNAKAKYDLVNEFVEQGKDAILMEELDTEKIELAESERAGIKEAISKYTNYTTASGMPSKDTGDLLLKKFEDNAKQTMDKFLKETQKQGEQPAHDDAERKTQEDVRRKYFKAKAIYEEIALKTGNDSPSKIAERKVIATAEVSKKKTAVATAIIKMSAPSDLANVIHEQSLEVGQEALDSIKYAQDNEDFGEVLNDAKANPEVAAELAKDMLAAKTEDDVALAIANAHSAAALAAAEGESAKLAIREQNTLDVRRITTDIKVKKFEEELFAELDKATDVTQLDDVQKKMEAKAEAWKVSVTADIQQTTANATSNLAAAATEATEKIHTKLAEIKVAGAVRRTGTKAKWALKEISGGVGQALNLANNDAEASAALADAKKKAAAVEADMQLEIDAVVATLPASGVAPEKIARYTELMEEAKADVKLELGGIQVFTEIAESKIESNVKMTQLKKELDSTLSKAVRPEQTAAAITRLETEAKKVSDAWTQKIQLAGTQIKELRKGKELDVDPSTLPESFSATDSFELLSNPDFVEKTGSAITGDIEAAIVKSKQQAGQKAKKADADNKLKDVKGKIEAARAEVLAKAAKVAELRDSREQSKKRLLEVSQLTKVQAVLTAIPESPEAVAAATKRAAAKMAKERVELALETRAVREARIDAIKSRLVMYRLTITEYTGRRETIKARLVELRKALERVQRRVRAGKVRLGRLRLTRERAAEAAKKAELLFDEAERKRIDDEKAAADAEVEAAAKEDEALRAEEDAALLADTTGQEEAEQGLLEIDGEEADANVLEDLQLAEAEEIDAAKEYDEAEADILVQDKARAIADEEADTADDLADAGDKVTAAAKLTEEYDAVVTRKALEEGKFDTFTTELETLATEQEAAETATPIVVTELARISARMAVVTETELPQVEENMVNNEEEVQQLEFAKAEFESHSTIAVDVANASMQVQEQNEEARAFEDQQTEIETVVLEVAGEIDPEALAELDIAIEEAQIEEEQLQAANTAAEAVKLATAGGSDQVSTIETEFATVKNDLEASAKTALALAKSAAEAKANAALALIEDAKAQEDYLRQQEEDEETAVQAEEAELAYAEKQAQLEETRKNLKSIAELIPLQEKLDEAKARAEKLAAYREQVAAAAAKAEAAMKERKEAAIKAAEVEKQIAAAKKLADEAKAKAQAALKERAEKMQQLVKTATAKATLVTKQAKNMTTIGELLTAKTLANKAEESSIDTIAKTFCIELATVYASDNYDNVKKYNDQHNETAALVLKSKKGITAAWELAKELRVLAYKELKAADAAVAYRDGKIIQDAIDEQKKKAELRNSKHKVVMLQSGTYGDYNSAEAVRPTFWADYAKTAAKGFNKPFSDAAYNAIMAAPTEPVLEDGSVRLESYPRGRINIYKNGEWNTMVGHYFWDNNEGGINICKQLGYAEGGRRYTAGKGSKLPQLDTWRICYGGEKTFFDCAERGHNGAYKGTDHNKDQGVSCSGTRYPPNPRQNMVCNEYPELNLSGCPNGSAPEYKPNQIDFDRHYYEAVRARKSNGKYLPVIIQRECSDCVDSHKNIFYKRLNPINRYFDAYHMFIQTWRTSYKKDTFGDYKISNQFNKDFELYSTLDDALKGKNRWTYCNFNDWVGFPRDCGPTRKTNYQWNGILKGQVRGKKNYQYSYFKPIKCPAGTFQNEDGMTCSVENCADGERRVYPEIVAPYKCSNDEEIKITSAADSTPKISDQSCYDVTQYPNGLESFNCRKTVDAANYAIEEKVKIPFTNSPLVYRNPTTGSPTGSDQQYWIGRFAKPAIVDRIEVTLGFEPQNMQVWVGNEKVDPPMWELCDYINGSQPNTTQSVKCKNEILSEKIATSVKLVNGSSTLPLSFKKVQLISENDCKKDMEGKSYRCEACPSQYGLMVNPSDNTKCTLKSEVNQVMCKRGHRIDQIKFKNFGGEFTFSHKGFAGGSWRDAQSKETVNLGVDERITKVEGTHIVGGYLNNQLSKIVYYTNKDRHVSCSNTRMKFKNVSKMTFEAPVGEYITSVVQYQDKRKCCGKLTGITSKKMYGGYKSFEAALDTFHSQKCSMTQFVGRDNQGRRACTDCPATFTRILTDVTKCQKVCPKMTYISDDGQSCVSDVEKCSVWESVDEKGKCQRCEQKKTVQQAMVSVANTLAQNTPELVVLKDAKQSSTWPRQHRGMMLEAKNAIDDNIDSFAHTRMGRGHWWKANFTGGNRTVQKVVITNRQDCCGERLKNTKVYIGREGRKPKLCGTLPSYTETKKTYTVTCAKNLVGDHVFISQNTYTTALQLATVKVFALDDCLIDEKLTGHKCTYKSGWVTGQMQCQGERTCSRWGWCQGESKCTNTIAQPVEVKPYAFSLEEANSKCVEGQSESDFADDQTTDVTLDECSELAFENTTHKQTLFHHRLADPATSTKSVCQICKPDATGAYPSDPLYRQANAAGFKIYKLVPVLPSVIQSWDKLSCQEKCEAGKYMDTTVVPNVCKFLPKCTNKFMIREAKTGDCVTCGAGQQPDAEQRLCVESSFISIRVKDVCAQNAVRIGDEQADCDALAREELVNPKIFDQSEVNARQGMLYFSILNGSSNNDKGCFICKDEIKTTTAEKGTNVFKYLSYRKFERLGVTTEIVLKTPAKKLGNFQSWSGKIPTVEACWEFVNTMQVCDKTKPFSYDAPKMHCGCNVAGENPLEANNVDSNLFEATETTAWVTTAYGSEHGMNMSQTRQKGNMNKPNKALINNGVKMNEYLKAYELYEAARAVPAKFMLADQITGKPAKSDGSAYVKIQTQGDCASNGALGRYKKMQGGGEYNLPGQTKEECAKDIEKLKWLGEIQETDYLFMFTLNDADTDQPNCKICSKQLGEDGDRSQASTKATLYSITEWNDQPQEPTKQKYFMSTVQTGSDIQGQTQYWNTWFEDYLSATTTAPKEQLVYEVDIIAIRGKTTVSDGYGLKMERFAYNADVYVGTTICGQTGTMPPGDVALYRVIRVRCNKPVWGTQITIQKQGELLGFYSVSIKSAGVRYISFGDVAKFKQPSIYFLENRVNNESGDSASVKESWTNMLNEFQKTELNAVFLPAGEYKTCKPYSQDSTSGYFPAKSVTEAAKKIMDMETLLQGDQTRDFAYSAALGQAVWCYKTGTVAYNSNTDLIVNEEFNVYTARATLFNNNSDEYVG